MVAGALGSGLGGFAGGLRSAGVWSEGLMYGCAVNGELLFPKLESLGKWNPQSLRLGLLLSRCEGSDI